MQLALVVQGSTKSGACGRPGFFRLLQAQLSHVIVHVTSSYIVFAEHITRQGSNWVGGHCSVVTSSSSFPSSPSCYYSSPPPLFPTSSYAILYYTIQGYAMFYTTSKLPKTLTRHFNMAGHSSDELELFMLQKNPLAQRHKISRVNCITIL